MSKIAEFDVEGAALELFAGLGYAILHGRDVAAGELLAERASYADVVLVNRLRSALQRINPKLPVDAGGTRLGMG
jgi:type I restriction enzyme R subunit